MNFRAEPVDRVHVSLGDRSYDVLIGVGLVQRPSSLDGLQASADAMIVTNEVVAPLHLAPVLAALKERYARVHVTQLPDGEAHKDWPTLNRIFDALLGAGCDRRTTLYALGGGVVGDMAGFAAACYMRGVPYVQIPTTLLAQVDSSVGGKTAINHPLGKNMIGAFHQPLRVLCDLGLLKTLPEREFRSGLAEVIKYGPIADWAFFEWLEAHADELMSRDADALAHAVRRSCEIKADVVSRDEREGDVRAILNFGHTFGHAIEAGLGYGTWLHGEAVACGMVMAARLSVRMNLARPEVAQRLQHLLARCGLPVQGPAALAPQRYLDLMRLDKKARSGEIQFVLLDGPGSAAVRPAADAVVREVLVASSAGPA
ncbi:MAG: 3-dehydroquinate synthase [Burkholderiaceae bacterium]